MLALQADSVYQRYRELVLANPVHGFDLEHCPDCSMNHGRVVGEGVLEPAPLIQMVGQAPREPFVLSCQVCSGTMINVGEGDVLRWMDVIGSILMYLDLKGRGVYAGADTEEA